LESANVSANGESLKCGGLQEVSLLKTAEKMIVVFGLMLATAYRGLPEPQAGKTAADTVRGEIVGTWRGHSTCTVKDSPCHDERNVYRVAEIPGKPDLVRVTGGKIVDGKEIVMGTSDWKYDLEKKTLEWEGPHGTFRLGVQGDTMEGTLTDKDGTVYRRISLKKEK
jgi:hypothetical protein